MATVTPTITKYGNDTLTISWSITTANYDGAPVSVQIENYADRTATIVAANWGGATLQIQGSNDGTNYFVCQNPYGEDLSFTANGMQVITEMPLFLRPYLTVVGTAATPVVVIAARKQHSGRASG